MVHNIDDFLKAGPLDRTVHTVNGFYFKKDKKKSNSKSHAKAVKHHHKAALEIPVEFDGSNGLRLQNKSRLAVSTSFPVYSTNADEKGSRQDAHCSLSSLTALHGKIGYTTGSATLSFNHFHGSTSNINERRTTFLASLGVPKPTSSASFSASHGNHSAKIPSLHLGLSTKRNSEKLGAEIIFPNPSADLSQHSLVSLLASKNSKIRNNTMQLQTKLSTSFCPSSSILQSTNLNISLQPENRNNGENVDGIPNPSCSLKLGWNRLQKSYRPHVGLSISAWLPFVQELCSKMLLDLSFTWRGNNDWQLGAMWTQMKTQETKKVTAKRHFRVGVNWARQLSWIFSWTEGDLKLQIPVFLSSSATPLFYYQCLYHFFFLSFLSQNIQDVIGHVIFSKRIDDESSDKQKQLNPSERIRRARQDALDQQTFMQRQATIRTKAESEVNGLVIQRAIYYVRQPGVRPENASDTLDVTIPLQFWVSDSKLEFYEAARRSNMLGFCNLVGVDSTSANGNRTSNTTRSDGMKSWLLSLWFDGERDSLQSNSRDVLTAVPELKVWYDYAGRYYEIIIGDDEEITLPSSRASLA